VVEVVDVDACTDPRWRDLETRAGGSLFHGSTWMSVLGDTYGFSPRALLALDGGRVLNGMPWCRVDDPGGARIVSLPFSDYCGPLGPPPFDRLFGALVDRGLPVRYREVVDHDAPDDVRCGFRTTGRARWHGVPVTTSPEADAWPALRDSTRRAVAKARREGVTVVDRSDVGVVADFFCLHLGVRKHKYRLLPQPRSFFESMHARFGVTGDWHALTAMRDGEVLAVTVYLRHRDTLFYKFNASDPAGLGARPNDLLLWSGIELAATLGCTLLDLGASDDDQPGLVRFKQGFGAIEREIRTRVAGPALPEPSERFRSMLGDMTSRLTAPDVPDTVTADAGARLYRYFA
jgi:CelD/BcsL family acetyltransferase involved in cellulose biosynthesis